MPSLYADLIELANELSESNPEISHRIRALARRALEVEDDADLARSYRKAQFEWEHR